jgi:hypothetical protein
VSVEPAGGTLAKWTFSEDILDASGVDVGAFNVDASGGVEWVGNTDNWAIIDHDTPISSGLPWFVNPPTGVDFDGGGDVASQSGSTL